LLQTLDDLLQYPNVTCVLASHSIRTHLVEFYDLAQQQTKQLHVELMATVTLPDDDKTTAVASAHVEAWNQPLQDAPKKSGLVHIARIERATPQG
jgi:hypothetical protein